MPKKIPGLTAKHAIITPNCRTVVRPEYDPDPRVAAFEEAVNRLREEYRAICDARDDAWTGHVVLRIEGPERFADAAEEIRGKSLDDYEP